MFYKFPKCSQTDLKKNIHCLLRPVIDSGAKLVIMGDFNFNIQVNEARPPFVHFMETLFNCHQCIQQPITVSGSVLDLVLANCDAFSDAIKAY